jgi:hypothetical protein
MLTALNALKCYLAVIVIFWIKWHVLPQACIKFRPAGSWQIRCHAAESVDV